MAILIPLLVVCGPVGLTAVLLAAAFAWASGALPAAVIFALFFLSPALAAAAAVQLLYRWNFPAAYVRTASLCAAVVSLKVIVSSPESLHLVGVVATRLFSAPQMPAIELGVQEWISLARELSLIGGLSVAVVMLVVLLFEVPLRILTSTLNGSYELQLARSARFIASLTIVLAGWFLFEDGARGHLVRLAHILKG